MVHGKDHPRVLLPLTLLYAFLHTTPPLKVHYAEGAGFVFVFPSAQTMPFSLQKDGTF